MKKNKKKIKSGYCSAAACKNRQKENNKKKLAESKGFFRLFQKERG